MYTRVFRFAPSPNGYLHLGHAYSALLNYDMARACGGQLLLRIENIDATRCRPEFEMAIYEDLHWLGISWTGPVRRQSEHFADYRAAIAKLEAAGLLYPSFESRSEITAMVADRERAGSWPRDPDGVPLYPGSAKELSAEERRRWYEEGMAIDPSNTLIPYRYMFSLRPRWGGSYRQMEDFLAQEQAQQTPPALLARLAMLIHADQAEDAMQAGDNQKIFDEWQQVLRLAEVAKEQPGTEALIGYTSAAQDLDRPADARWGIEQLEDRHPEDAWSQVHLAWIYLQAHQDVKAWPLLLKAAEHNDSWAQWLVGHGTYDGVPTLHKAADQRAGLVWIRRSAEKCFPDAVQFLAARGEKPSTDCKRRRSGGEREWWETLIPAAGLLFTSLVTALAAALRKRAQPTAPPARMQYPESVRAIGTLLAALAILTAAVAVTAENGAGGPVLVGVLAALAAFGLLLIVGSVRVWHVLTADGLEFGRLLGRRGSLKWRDVTRLTYSKGMRWFRIETAAGEVVRISAILTGLPDFAGAVLEQVPSYAIDDGAREVLQAYAINRLIGRGRAMKLA